MFYDNLKALCEKRGVKVTNVVSALGCSQGSMSHWKAGGVPNASTLKKFADFFGVSTDVLISGEEVTNNPATALYFAVSDEKREMINLILSLPDDKVKVLRQIAQAALDL